MCFYAGCGRRPDLIAYIYLSGKTQQTSCREPYLPLLEPTYRSLPFFEIEVERLPNFLSSGLPHVLELAPRFKKDLGPEAVPVTRFTPFSLA